MVALICSLVGLVTACIAWRSGYAAGNEDGRSGVSAPWPWSTETREL
jgi:hypothetical protein